VPPAERITFYDGFDSFPMFSPDGKRIAFSSRRGGNYEVFLKTLDAATPETRLATVSGDKYVEDWSRDGRYLSVALERSGLWVVPLTGSEKPWVIRPDPRQDTWQSAFSPDLKWLAYMSEESGRPEVYVVPFPENGERWKVSIRVGAEPHWSGHGRELFYLGTDGRVMSIDTTRHDWQRQSPTPLLHISVPYLAGSPDYSVAPDGQTFVVNEFVAGPPTTPVQVVVNWTTLLKR